MSVGAVALASCSQTAASEVEVQGPTIVSLNPCTDAILLEVADPRQVLAISHYSHDPRASSIAPEVAREFNSTGGTVEEILALNPDIVIAGSLLAPASVAALANLNFRVELYGSTNKIDDSYAQIRAIGVLVGHQDRASKLIERIEQSLAHNAPAGGQEQITATMWQPGQIVPGEATLVSELMERTGFASHSQARGLGQADYLSLEQVIADPPELLMIAGDARAQQHPALEKLDSTRIEGFDPSLLYCGGPSIIRASKRLSEIRRHMK
ncbi:MAG TPA: iron ABC transporter substrate-binding protein [Erythrobacter sp.]|nr:iron ABC transporter substrate-binding protein [Erythrobacter sp.]